MKIAQWPDLPEVLEYLLKSDQLTVASEERKHPSIVVLQCLKKAAGSGNVSISSTTYSSGRLPNTVLPMKSGINGSSQVIETRKECMGLSDL